LSYFRCILFFICLNNFYSIIICSIVFYFFCLASLLMYSLYDFKKLNKSLSYISLGLSSINKFTTVAVLMIVWLLLNIRCHNIFIFFNHVTITSNVLLIWQLFLALFLVVLYCYKTFFVINALESSEHIILLFNFFLIVPFLTSVLSMISLIVLIEVVSLLALLLIVNSFACSSFIFKNKTTKAFNSSFNKDVNILYALIINFWVSLGSSLFFFIAILNLFYNMYSSDINMLESLAPVLPHLSVFGNCSWLFFFLLGIFLKIALPPIFFWKIIFFKNLPNHVLFFYVNIFFSSIFFILLLIIVGNSSLLGQSNLLILNSILFFGFFSAISFMLNMLNFKIFIAFSSVFNLLMLLLISINSTSLLLI